MPRLLSSLGAFYSLSWAWLGIPEVYEFSINLLELLAAIAFLLVSTNPFDHHTRVWIDLVAIPPHGHRDIARIAPGRTTPPQKQYYAKRVAETELEMSG